MAFETNVINSAPDPPVMSPASCTAIVTAYQRIEQTLATLENIRHCEPAPAEIITHVDGNNWECASAVESAFPDVKVIVSYDNLGPGGGRNKLIAAASSPIVASFDDDSYPLDRDYFARVERLFAAVPEAAILAAAVYHRGEDVVPASARAEWTADFVGCGCAYRREAFLKTGGYVPLPIAYGMEEVDLAIRLHAARGKILRTTWLRVFHDTDLKQHASSEITSATIANLALLAFLRYPLTLLPIGACQVARRVLWSLRHGRHRGILSGLMRIPTHLIAHRAYRQPQSLAAVNSYRRLRREPQPVCLDISRNPVQQRASSVK